MDSLGDVTVVPLCSVGSRLMRSVETPQALGCNVHTCRHTHIHTNDLCQFLQVTSEAKLIRIRPTDTVKVFSNKQFFKGTASTK